MEKNIINEIERIIDYSFNTKGLLIQAFTRESYARERQIQGEEVYGNEQLEFFGDAVLNYVLVKNINERFCILQNENLVSINSEGQMTNFVSHFSNKQKLAECVERMGLNQYLLINKGDKLQNASDSINVKEDLFEAIVGAVWIDCNKEIDIVEKLIFRMLDLKLFVVTDYLEPKRDLLNLAVEKNLKLEYKVDKIDDEYCVTYYINELGISETAKDKKKINAENKAAEKLINLLGKSINSKIAIDFNLDNAINKLQELSQKRIIGQIKYFEEFDYNNNIWETGCAISNFEYYFVGKDKVKLSSKKKAAFNVLESITKMGYERLNMYKKDVVFIVYETEKDQFNIKVGYFENRSNGYLHYRIIDNSIIVSIGEADLNVCGVFKSIYDAICDYFKQQYYNTDFNAFKKNRTYEYLIYKEEEDNKEYIDEYEHLILLKNIVDYLDWDEYLDFIK